MLLCSCNAVDKKPSSSKKPDLITTYDLLVRLGDSCINIATDAAIKLQSYPQNDLLLNTKKLFENKEPVRVLEQSVYFCQQRVPNRVRELLPLGISHSYPRVISAAIHVLTLSKLNPSGKEVDELAPFLKHENVIVRLRTAELLRNHGRDEEVFQVLVSELENFDTSDYYDDWFPAAAVAKNVLTDWKPEDVLKGLIIKLKPVNPVVKYHLIDAAIVASGTTSRYIFSKRGNPTKEMIETLDIYAKRIGISY